MTVRYMIVTDNRDGTTTHAVVETLDDARRVIEDAVIGTSRSAAVAFGACVTYAAAASRAGGTVTIPDGRTFTVTPVVWRGKGYVRADVSAIAGTRGMR